MLSTKESVIECTTHYREVFIQPSLLHFTSYPGTSWPTAELVDPPSGILIVGVGRSASISFNVYGEPFPRDKKWFKDGQQITSTSSIL